MQESYYWSKFASDYLKDTAKAQMVLHSRAQNDTQTMKLSLVWFFMGVLDVVQMQNGHHTEESIGSKKVISDESRLLLHLFGSYDNEVRPVLNESNNVNVTFSLALIQLFNVNSKSQVLTVNVWVRQEWYNHLLSWNPADFGGITTLNLEPTRVWIPDIILYNNADGTHGGGIQKFKTKVIVEHDGMNKWYSPASFTSTCDINVRMFPFDQQSCILKFGSWTYTGDRLVMHATEKSVDLDKYHTNGEWELLSMTHKLNAVKYSCCEHLFYDVTFYMSLKRKPLYYIFNLILPCAIIFTLTLMKFFLPVESGEKIGLGITVLLAMTVFLMIVADSLPSTSDSVPLLGSYFVALMFNTSLSLIASCIILGCYYKNPNMTPMPRWFRKLVFYYLARVMFLKSRKQYLDNRNLAPRARVSVCSMNGSIGSSVSNLQLNRQHSHSSDDPGAATSLIDLEWETEFNGSDADVSSSETDRCGSARSESYEAFVDAISFKLAEGIGTIADSYRRCDKEEELRDEWKHASLVLDLFFFYLFLFLQMISIIVIFGPLASANRN